MFSLPQDLLILGSQNSKIIDQDLTREEIKPVQILRKDKTFESVDFFNSWGRVGVSSITWHPGFENHLIVSTNDELRFLDTLSKTFEVLDIDRIGDIHDIEVIDNLLWISNTEFDEAISYDLSKKKVIERVSLAKYRVNLSQNSSEEKLKDQFHCNQVFQNFDGDLCVLIHNITGWQYYRIVLEMLIRRQGDGGIINIDRDQITKLKLQSPHSVRLIKDEYWIQDSGDQSTKVFDKDWNLKHTVKNGGFGRGVAFSIENNLAFVGISATRKRYLRVIPSGEKMTNRVIVIDINSKKRLDSITIPNIEQTDNVYLYTDELEKRFRNLK